MAVLLMCCCRVVLDDFREAYYWLRHNTKPDARIMSWWDYGYQITSEQHGLGTLVTQHISSR